MRVKSLGLVLILLFCFSCISLAEQQISTAFLFHFNQDMVPYSELSDHACYIGLLEMMRSLKPTPFVLHISGTLLLEWQWSKSPALDLIKEGIADGQFEILGSTFAQNVIYSVDAREDNSYQIQLHKEILADILGVSPTGFWNAERVWDNDLIDLIGEWGYEYTFLETPILAASGVEHSELRKLHGVEGEQHKLILIPDDLDFRNNVNRRQTAGVVGYLKAMNRRNETGDYLILYAEDAEATGLWDLEGGKSPEGAWEEMRRVLVRLIEEPQVKIIKISDFIKEQQAEIPVITAATGQANWMIGPSVQAGYKDWFDYNATNPDLAYFRELYNKVSGEIQRVASMAAGTDFAPVEQLLNHARQTLAITQYEFAAIGAGHKDVAIWELARTALVPTKIAEWLLTGLPQEPLFLDINADGIEEIIVVDRDNFYVFSPIGAKLLYWFQLDTGQQLVGQEASFYYGELFENDSMYVPELAVLDPLWFWLPESDYLEPLLAKKYVVRRRVANDIFIKEGEPIYDYVDAPYQVSLEENRLVFRYSDDVLTIRKTYRPQNGNLILSYLLTGAEDYQYLQVENGLVPAYFNLLRTGARGIVARKIGAGFLVENEAADVAIKLSTNSDVIWQQPGHMRYGEQVNALFRLSGDKSEFELQFQVISGGNSNE